jgi:hypothetical protein
VEEVCSGARCHHQGQGFYEGESLPDCLDHSTGNGAIDTSVGAVSARPCKIASTVAGASSVNLSTRLT